MQKLDPGLGASERHPAPSSLHNGASTSTDPYYHAARIVQSIPYFMQPSVGVLMHKIFAFPLATAYAYFASFPSGSVTTSSPKTSQSPTSTVAGLTESFDSAGTNGSPPASEASKIEADVVQTYLEATAKAMHIYGVQINILCQPAS
jgi:hypothetical protein